MVINEVWIALVAASIALFLWLSYKGKQAQRADWGNPVLNRLDGLNRLFCEKFHHLKHDSIEAPTNGGAIVAANHVSGLDPLLMSCACTKPLRYMIATEQYNRPLLHWLYQMMGAIPVDRKGAPDRAFYAARQALSDGQLVSIYPQGRIAHPGDKVALKRGVVLLADLANAPIIPVRITGVSGVGRVITAIFIRSRARLEVGPPIYVKGPKDSTALSTLAAFITDTTACEQPDQR